MRVIWMSTVLGLVVLGACSSSDPESDSAGSSGFGSAERAGTCEIVETELAENEAGVATRERAITEFVDTHSILDAATIRGDTISYEGQAVGTITVVERPAGGFGVIGAQWCYPG